MFWYGICCSKRERIPLEIEGVLWIYHVKAHSSKQLNSEDAEIRYIILMGDLTMKIICNFCQFSPSIPATISKQKERLDFDGGLERERPYRGLVDSATISEIGGHVNHTLGVVVFQWTFETFLYTSTFNANIGRKSGYRFLNKSKK